MPAIDYNAVESVSAEDFRAAVACEVAEDGRIVADPPGFTRSDDEDIAKMERLLDLMPGTLAGQNYYLGQSQCECGRTLTMYDFVFTGLVDAGHSKSLILHTFVGSKFVLNPPRRVRCSECGRISAKAEFY
jgi:hypothetical protein